MRKFLFSILILLCACGPNGLHGWWPGTDPQPSNPTSGNKIDVNVYYKNTCGTTVIVFYGEVSPGSNVQCENLIRYGQLGDNETTNAITIHQGKIGYIVFALNDKGKCTDGQRKFEGWIHTENSTATDAHFTSCP